MNSDPTQQLEEISRQMQLAIENVKNQKMKENKRWKETVASLEDEIAKLRVQLSESVQTTCRLNGELEQMNTECEKLREANIQLTKKIQEKDKQISNFTALSQNLREMLDSTRPDVASAQPQQYNELNFNYESQQRTAPMMIPTQSYGMPKMYQNSYGMQMQMQQPMSQRYEDDSDNEKSVSQSSVPKPVKKSSKGRKSQQFLQSAREQLSDSDFAKLINAITEYNSKRANKEQTLKIGFELLGKGHDELYRQFASMIA